MEAADESATGSVLATLLGDMSADAVGGAEGGLAGGGAARMRVAAGATAAIALGGEPAAALGAAVELDVAAAAAAGTPWLAACGTETAGDPALGLPGVGVGDGSGSPEPGVSTTSRSPLAAVDAPASSWLTPCGIRANFSWSASVTVAAGLDMSWSPAQTESCGSISQMGVSLNVCPPHDSQADGQQH